MILNTKLKTVTPEGETFGEIYQELQKMRPEDWTEFMIEQQVVQQWIYPDTNPWTINPDTTPWETFPITVEPSTGTPPFDHLWRPGSIMYSTSTNHTEQYN